MIKGVKIKSIKALIKNLMNKKIKFKNNFIKKIVETNEAKKFQVKMRRKLNKLK